MCLLTKSLRTCFDQYYRHEQVIDSMKKEMHSIGQEMEKEVISACKTLNKNLSIFDKGNTRNSCLPKK